MKKTIDQKIEEAIGEQNDIALELVQDLEISSDLGDNYACFISKELYHAFQKLDEKLCKLHDKKIAEVEEENKKQLKLAFKRK
jgi:hypothetical protein